MDQPRAVPQWKVDLSETGNVVLSLAHAATPEDATAGQVEWSHFVLTPQQAALLGKGLLKAEGQSPQMMGMEE